MTLFPFAKIAAIFALIGFLPALLMKPAEVFPGLKEMKYLVFLFLQLCVAVPFSIWRGGSAEIVFEEFWKVVLIGLCASVAVNTVSRLRRLLWAQAIPVAIMVLFSAAGFGEVIVDNQGRARMSGMLGGIFENPNDYAFAVALVFPVAVMFMLHGRNLFSKLTWAVISLAMIYVVFQTLSRGGLLALVVAIGFLMWEHGIRQKRYGLIFAAVLALFVLVAAAPDRFATRVQSIFDFNKDETGSGWARRALLEKSIDTALANPLLGVGPGNFQTLSGNWHGAHNTYTQLASEAGLPAVLFLILLLGRSIRNMTRLKRSATDPAVQALASALSASLICYAVGAFFADTAYHFFPYLFLGYAAALHQIAGRGGVGASDPAKKGKGTLQMYSREQPAVTT